jgi:hypothetical protein
MEFFLQYDSNIVYMKYKDNLVADTLSRFQAAGLYVSLPSLEAEATALPLFHDATIDGKITSIFLFSSGCTALPFITSLMDSVALIPTSTSVLKISADSQLLDKIRAGYLQDPFIKSLKAASLGMHAV